MSHNTALFRAEAVQAAQAQWLGSIRINRPASFAWVTGLSLCMAVALVSYTSWGQVSRKAKLPGILMPTAGMLTVGTPQAGVVTEVLVHEGDLVEAGQVLARIKSERNISSGDAAALNAQALAQRRASLDTERILTVQQQRQRQDALRDRLRSLESEERQVQAELDTNHLRVGLAAKSLSRFSELEKHGFVSAVQSQQKQEELLDVQLRERNAERNLAALRRDIHALRAEILSAETGSRTSLAQIDRSLATLRQEITENEARGGLTLTAPQAGRVSALNIHPGQTVQAGQTLLNLIPGRSGEANPPLEAQLYAPSRTAGFIKSGQAVWLRYAAYPYQKFGMAEGVVQSISQTPVEAQDLPIGQAQALLTAAQANEPLYRISVKLKSRTSALTAISRCSRRA